MVSRSGPSLAGQVTLLREHCQGPNQMMFVLPTGGFDPSKHADWLACAKAELSEEVGKATAQEHHLGGAVIPSKDKEQTRTDLKKERRSREDREERREREKRGCCYKDVALDCADYQQACLHGGTWQPLLAEDHPGIAEVKWCANRFTPFLCIDPQVRSSATNTCRPVLLKGPCRLKCTQSWQADNAPGRRDAEEFIEVHRFAIKELRSIMVSGEMLLPSVSTCYMALERLGLL